MGLYGNIIMLYKNLLSINLQIYLSIYRPSLATSPNRSSLPAGLQGYIPYPHIAAVCMFEMVVLLLLVYMWGSIGVHHFWARTLLLQQCPACLVRLTWIVFVMGGRWPYGWCLVGCSRQGLFNIAHNILVYIYIYIYIYKML